MRSCTVPSQTLLDCPNGGRLSGCTIQVALSLMLVHSKHAGSGMMLTALMPTEFTGQLSDEFLWNMTSNLSNQLLLSLRRLLQLLCLSLLHHLTHPSQRRILQTLPHRLSYLRVKPCVDPQGLVSLLK